MKKSTPFIIIVIAILALGTWYYFSKTPSNEASESTATEVTEATPSLPAGSMETGEISSVDATAGATAGAVKEFTVTGSNFTFAPKTLTVKKGDHVKITLENSGGTHDLKIDEFAVATPRIGSGESASVEFVADKTGSFEYYCSVGNHRAMGMWGTLTVTE